MQKFRKIPGEISPTLELAKSIIKKAIIDKNARIGKHVKLLNKKGVNNEDGKNYYIRDGIILIPKNAVLENNTTI